MDLEDKVLRRIEQEGVRMRPRWFFDAKNTFYCVSAFVLVIFSALSAGLSFALIAHLASEISWVNFPYSLIALSALLGFFAYESLIRSFSFYRIRTSLMVASIVTIALSFACIIFAYGWAEGIEEKMQHSEAYKKIAPQALWGDEKSERGDR